MAGGLFEGVFGDDEEGASEELVRLANAEGQGLAASMAMDVARTDPLVAAKAAQFLDEQTRLLQQQAAHAAAEHPLRMSHMRSQSREGRLRRTGQRVRLVMQIVTALFLGVIGLGVVAMLHDAFTSNTVVVEAFDAPPALADRGINGKLVATGVLDSLQKLQDATRSSEKGLSTRNAWSGDVKIDVPETGVSIGEIDRFLHERFGHDVHISGDLVQNDSGGLALTVRGDGVPARTFDGPAASLDQLTTTAAEYVYGRSQPGRYAVYLEDIGRDKDAVAFLPGAFARATDDAQRAKLANSWGSAYDDLFQPDQAAPKYRLEMSLSPPRSNAWWRGWCNLIAAVTFAQGEEASWREAEAFLQAVAAAPERERPRRRLMTNAAGSVWDLPLLLGSYFDDLAMQGGAANSPDGPMIAETYAELHDPARAARYLATSDPDDPETRAEALLLQSYPALDRGDPATAIAPLEAFYRMWLASPLLEGSDTDQACFLGLAYGLVGRRAEANAVFRRINAPWSRCYAFEGEALAHSGDVEGAQRVWAEGVRLLPDLPNVYLARGRWEMDHGDLREAGVDLSTAATKAPHFPDTLKAWGDLLAREGKPNEALAKYDAALHDAPAWADLRQARDAAANKVSRAGG